MLSSLTLSQDTGSSEYVYIAKTLLRLTLNRHHLPILRYKPQL